MAYFNTRASQRRTYAPPGTLLEGHWVAMLPVNDDFPVKMRTGRVPGASHRADILTGSNRLTRSHRHRVQVRIQRLDTIAVVDDDEVTV